MINRTTLTEKLVIYFLFLNISAVLIAGLLSHINSKAAINQRTFDHLNSVKYVKKRQIESFFKDRLNEVEMLCKTGLIAKIAGSNLSSGKTMALNGNNKNTNHFADLLNSFPYFSHAAIFLSSNDIINLKSFPSTNALSLSNSMKDGIVKLISGTECIPIIYEDKDITGNTHTILILSKINLTDNANNKRYGAVVFEIDPSVLNSIMLETNPNEGLGKSGESYIIGIDKRLRTKSRFFQDSTFHGKIETESALKAVDGQTGTVICKDYRQVEVLSSYGRLEIPGLDWFILAEIDLSEAEELIITNRNNILALTLIIAGVVFILTYILARKISIPITRLTEATNRIATGNYNEELEQVSNDEIGNLTNTFNNMARTLNYQRLEIEKERRKRSLAAIEALEKERIRLSRELHDGLGQTLISQKLKLECIEPANTSKSIQIIEDVKKSIDQTINEVRHISNDLMPAVLLEFGLVNAIRKLSMEVNEYSSMKMEFITDMDKERLDEKTRIYLFRIAQEATKNVIRHSGASKCEINLSGNDSMVSMSIRDDGRGFEKNGINEGNGLINIRERVNLLSGDFTLNSCKGKGTELTISIPLGSK